MQRYNGMDNIVCFDAWAEIVQQLSARGLEEVARHDHQLLTVLYAMQKQGFRVDAKARQEYEEQAQGDLILAEEKLQELAQPIIVGKIARFKKPSLFRQQRKCKCCGGGKASRDHCWRCGGLKQKPKKKVDFVNTRLDDGTRAYLAPSGKMYWLPAHKTSELKAKLPACNACLGNGKVYEWLEFNPGSSDQVGDVVYRGLGITPRRYKGKETTNAAALSKIADKHPLIAELVATSKLRADISTVERLLPGTDGKLHCVFDPWGTESGRVAGKEGLLQAGTNPMNIPKAARRFVVPDAGYILMYPDMAQIEARVVAKLSEKYDSKLMLAFTKPIDWPGHEKHGKIDSHTFVQQLVSRWVEITRDQAKRLTYAAMYGVSGKQLAVELTAEAHRRGGAGMVNEQQGTAMLEAFFLAFPGVRQWHAAVEQEVMQSRTVVSLSGRERHWPGRVVDRKTGGITREILKQAWSFVPQDVGAWVLAEGIIAVANDKRCQDMDVQLMVHVHDAVLMQVPERYLPEAIYRTAKLLSRTMYGMWFPCEMKTGSNWYKVS
jgi:DNA polymerase I-like protein with 3'-5' exonuclease and polymerase domains